MEDFNKRGNDEVYSNSIRAGKRPYFSDVRKTRNGEMFLTITESKKIMTDDGTFHFEKHKIFLYKEDFEKFTNGLNEALEFISTSIGAEISDQETENPEQSTAGGDQLY